MRRKQTWIAALLAILLLITAGCGKSPDSTKDNMVIPAVPATEPAGKTAAAASLNSLRQAMIETPQLFAVAYFGYHETLDSPLPVDPFAVMQENAPQLCADLPFLLEIPEDRIVGETGDLFCIVPLDENATVAVSKGIWADSNGEYIYEDSLYYSESGEPILVLCNNTGWEPDTQVYISGPSGEALWYPGTDDNGCAAPLCNDNWDDLFMDFSPYREMLAAEYRRIKEDAEWEAVLPTKEMLIGNTWMWSGYLKDGRETRYSVTFREDTLSVSWNDGIDRMDHEYPDAVWELTYEGDYAILSIDFREFAGVLRYNLLYSMFYESLYVAQDVVQEDMNIGWEPLSRFLTKPTTPDPTDMAGTWELVWTEVEGDRSEAAPGSQTIEITTDYEGLYWISYTDSERSGWSYYNKELVVFPFALYDGCINDQWLGAVNYTGQYGTGYDVTLLNYDMLLLQEEWVVDGAPMVGYGYFRRVWDDCPDYSTESPYDYAISQGWRLPELEELVDSNWKSYIGYALDLTDDSVPGDNGGWVTVYDVDEIGAYTESYSGSWRYEDGMLHLSLVPANGNGVFVDDSFPVLMLNGQLWVGRSSSGLGLPHFYSDTLADVLDQPKG